MASNSARDTGRTAPLETPISDIRELKPAPIEAAAPVQTGALVMNAFGATDPGLLRARNEDQFVLSTLTGALWIEQSSFPQRRVRSTLAQGHLLIVADGMGGHTAGAEASQLAVEEIEGFVLGALTWLVELRSQDAGVLEELKAAIHRAHEKVTAQGEGQPPMRKMGTTVTIGYCIGDILYLAHAGDSRCYVLRRGKLRQITWDHTVASELVALGALDKDKAPDSVMRHVVTNVVGGGIPEVRAEVHKVPLQAGDVVLLCTDGLTDMVSDDHIAMILQEETDPRRACERLVVEANRAGGRDNITAIVAHFSAPRPQE